MFFLFILHSVFGTGPVSDLVNTYTLINFLNLESNSCLGMHFSGGIHQVAYSLLLHLLGKYSSF